MAYVQYSQLGFFVFVKHTEGKSTCDCHIVQSVFRMERKLDPNQAKPNTPASFEPMPTGPLYSWTAGNWIFDFLPRDYNGSETECMGKKLAAIVDQPTIKHTSAFAVADIRASSFQWSSTTYVKEAPSVSGGLGWTTSWNWDDGAQKVKTNFLARSHDGKIDIREVR